MPFTPDPPVVRPTPNFVPDPVQGNSASFRNPQQSNPFQGLTDFLTGAKKILFEQPIQKTDQQLQGFIADKTQPLRKAAKPVTDVLTKGANALGEVVGQQPILNLPLVKSPTQLQAFQTISNLAQGKGSQTPATEFLSGKTEQIPKTVVKDLTASYGAPQPGETDQQYQERMASNAFGAVGSMENIGKNVVKNVTKEVVPKAEDATAQYLKELAQAQKTAKGSPSVVTQAKGALGKIKSAMVSSVAPIEDALTSAEAKNKFKIAPTQDVRLQIDRVLKSTSLASQFAKDNGLVDAIQKAPDLHALDQYMIAKQASHVQSLGIQTGRDTVRDAKLVQDLSPQYEGLAQQVSGYSRKLLDYAVSSGLVDGKVANELKIKYPEYVPLERVFSEMEQSGKQVGTGKGVASLSKQTVVQNLKGSEREIASPIESLVKRTQTAFEQGERNKAGQMLASYKDLPGMEGLIKEVPSYQSVPTHSFSYLQNGVKKVFETTPEIAAAAKNLNQEQMNTIMKVIAYPTRTLKLGATGINLPFALTNLAKDQVTSFINTDKALKTSIFNPGNFFRALYSAVKHDDLYDEVVRNAGMQTSYDIARKTPDLAVNKFRSEKSAASKILYTVRSPKEMLRAVENIVGRTEELTRIQQYKGTYDALIKEGRTPADAKLLAAKNARESTANFSRSGSFGKVLNYMIPFFNAGIQGSRAYINALKARPGQTVAKTAIALFIPTTVATLWNTTDPTRKKVYDDIPDFEKFNNIIIIPDNPTQDAQGRWNVIKIPIPPGLTGIDSIVRNITEKTQGIDNLRASDVLTDLINTGTSVDVSSPEKVLSTFTPQILKPGLETAYNKNLFTGQDIVPFNMKDLPPEAQVKDTTSPIAIAIGKTISASPLLVENFIRTSLGGVGGQILGEDAIKQLVRRFSKATGGGLEGKEFQVIQEYKTQQALQTEKDKALATKVSDFLSDPSKTFEQKRQMIASLKQEQNQKIYDRVKQELQDRKAQVTSADKAVRALSVQQRAAYVITKLNTAKTKEEKVMLLQGYKDKEILTPDVIKEIKKQMGTK